MQGGIRLFRVLGIQISLDYTWFIVFVLFAWSLGAGYFPFHAPGLSRGSYVVMGSIAALLLFVCVLVHELAHSYTANRLGLDIKEITLFIFGGVARLSKEPQDAGTELKVALAGPAASLVLAVVFYLLSGAVGREQYPAVYAVVYYLSFINIVLFIFNMIPGFPLDGGRVFRAIWWAWTGDQYTATKVASAIGKGFAAFLIVLGLLQIVKGDLTGGLWAVLIGFFVRQAAESGYQQVLIKKALENVKVKDIMSRDVVTIDGNRTLAEAVEEYFFKYHFVSFPVTSDGGVIGLLKLGDIRAVEKQAWASTRVKDAMQRLGPEDSLSPDDSAADVLNRMSGDHVGRLTVIKDGELAGIISRRDILRLLELKAGLGQ